MDGRDVTQLVPEYFKINCRQYDHFSKNLTMLAFCLEPVLFPGEGISTAISFLERFNKIKSSIGFDAPFLLQVKS